MGMHLPTMASPSQQPTNQPPKMLQIPFIYILPPAFGLLNQIHHAAVADNNDCVGHSYDGP